MLQETETEPLQCNGKPTLIADIRIIHAAIPPPSQEFGMLRRSNPSGKTSRAKWFVWAIEGIFSN
jgi:hypothetical protein